MNPTSPHRRSCNECRQQKLRCDVVHSPFTPCTRCRKRGKICKIDTDFHRIGKRDKYAEMQQEIGDLRRQLRVTREGREDSVAQQQLTPPIIASAEGTDDLTSTKSRQLGHVALSGVVLDELFALYFQLYHPQLPFLDPQSQPDHYFGLSPLLGWSITMVAARRYQQQPSLLESLTEAYTKLVWSTISSPPQPYHIVKALCLTCYWPLPNTWNTKDSTYLLSGLMVQIALQNMLHLPFPAQPIQQEGLVGSDRRDRIITWVACTTVAEAASIVHGQLPLSTYDFMLALSSKHVQPYQIPSDLINQLRISQFCNSVTKKLYCHGSDPSGLLLDSNGPERSVSETLSQLSADFVAMEASLVDDASPMIRLHLLEAKIQLYAYGFFAPSASSLQDELLHSLYKASCAYIQEVMDQEISTGTLLEHCSILTIQTLISAMSALLKLLNSRFATQIDVEQGKLLFNSSLLAVRRMSIKTEDGAFRVATRTPAMWMDMGAGAPWTPEKPDPLALKIRFRMSASHRIDCMWRWVERMKAHEQTHAARDAQLDDTGTSVADTAPPASLPSEVMRLGMEETLFESIDSSLLGLDMSDFDLFNAMDWAV